MISVFKYFYDTKKRNVNELSHQLLNVQGFNLKTYLKNLFTFSVQKNVPKFTEDFGTF